MPRKRPARRMTTVPGLREGRGLAGRMDLRAWSHISNAFLAMRFYSISGRDTKSWHSSPLLTGTMFLHSMEKRPLFLDVLVARYIPSSAQRRPRRDSTCWPSGCDAVSTARPCQISSSLVLRPPFRVVVSRVEDAGDGS